MSRFDKFVKIWVRVRYQIYKLFGKLKLIIYTKDGCRSTITNRCCLYESPVEKKIKVDQNCIFEKMDFEVLYEDEHILLVNKPPGLVMHPGAGNGRGTLLNGLLAYRPDLTALPRAGIVHRLDKDTSGVLVIACNKSAYNKLTRMISRREVRRVYHAVCEGSLVSGFDIDLSLIHI